MINEFRGRAIETEPKRAFGLRGRSYYACGHVVENDRHLFVTTGIGTSILPVRFLVPPEVVVLTLR